MKTRTILVATLALMTLTALWSCRDEVINHFETQQEIDSRITNDGAINSLFSVSDDLQVRFSRGNLQYQASTNTWRFAENQYDYIGAGNANTSNTYAEWIDLFGWGTSGWNSGATAYEPYNISSNPLEYNPGGNYTNNITGDFDKADWGIQNAISNGGDQAGKWRTLTNSEWTYLLGNSEKRIDKYGLATIDTIHGLIILPDKWNQPYGLSFRPGVQMHYATNIYTVEQWKRMETRGAVFLPASGLRNGKALYYLNEDGYYWSTTYSDEHDAYSAVFSKNKVIPDAGTPRPRGRSVRLVMED